MINLTSISRVADNSPLAPSIIPEAHVEYSSREVSTPELLLQQLQRAHCIFLMHHGASLTEIWARSTRNRFCDSLKTFWDGFLMSWDVLLHGNPAVDIYNGLKLAIGGELGFGEGEEDWGSGERDVLEDFVRRTEGLLDLIVSRFDHMQSVDTGRELETKTCEQPVASPQIMPSDGVVFSGMGVITRPSIKAVSAWMEWVALKGISAYGVQDNPSSERRRKRSKAQRAAKALKGGPKDLQAESGQVRGDAGIPAPIVRPKGTAISINPPKPTGLNEKAVEYRKDPESQFEEAALGTEVMKYLTLGVYGSSWGIPAGRPSAQNAERDSKSNHRDHEAKTPSDAQIAQQPDGRFVVGLLGDLENEAGIDGHSEHEPPNNGKGSFNGRISMRHVYVSGIDPAETSSSASREEQERQQGPSPVQRLRVVVYVRNPFMFTFFFKPTTDSLSLPFFYRSLHHQLGPLKEPLMKSTDPAKVAQRVLEAFKAQSSGATRSLPPIQDLVHDPIRLTVHSTIPNIPDPSAQRPHLPHQWTRMEALSVHSQILNTYKSSRRHVTDLERTCKTSRGWWVVWMRLPSSTGSSSLQDDLHREAILIRRAHDHIAPKSGQTSSVFDFGFGRGNNGAASGWAPSRMMEGIGVDARQYIEGLLSLSR